MDRRQPAARVEFSDGNGGRFSAYSVNIKKHKAIISLLGSLVAIGVVVFGAARAGVSYQIKEEIEYQVREESSPIRMEMHAEIEEHCNELRRELQTTLEGIRTDVGAIRVDVATIETRQEAIRRRLNQL